MKKMLSLFAVVFFLVGPFAAASENEDGHKYVPNQIIVKFKSSTSDAIKNQLSNQGTFSLQNLPSGLSQLNRHYRIKKISPLIKNFKKRIKTHGPEARAAKQPNLDRIFKVELDLQSGQTFENALEVYKNNPDVEYAEPDYYVKADSTPNDPMNFAQWSLQKIQAQNAWDIYTGNHKTIVAVIDTGVDYNHPDLRNNMWVNEKEQNGIEGVDDDNNGYVDDIYGYNFIYRNGYPLDDYGHGTHCAGIIAAVGNNNFDTAGICWNARIMAPKL